MVTRSPKGGVGPTRTIGGDRKPKSGNAVCGDPVKHQCPDIWEGARPMGVSSGAKSRLQVDISITRKQMDS